ADSGGGLQLVHGVRPPRPAQAQDTLRDGAARHEDDAAALAHEARDLVGPARDRRAVEAAAGGGDERRADLDDQRLRLGERRHWRASSLAIAFDTASHPAPVKA